MVYINPDKQFFGIEDNLMVETNIENSIELGYDLKDIMLVTNFEYEHKGVKSIVVSDECYFKPWKQVSKMLGIMELFDRNLIEENEVYWFHDLDAFENNKVVVDIEGYDVGFTPYGYNDRWNTGSFLFKKSSRDIMQMITDWCVDSYKAQGSDKPNREINEEYALGDLTAKNVNNINPRIKTLNITYNYPGSQNGLKYFEHIYDSCDLPVQVLHFHPLRWSGRFYRMFHGGNPYNVNLITDRLLKILNSKGAYGNRKYTKVS